MTQAGKDRGLGTSHPPSTKQPGTVKTAEPSRRETNNQHCTETQGASSSPYQI